MQTAIKQVIQLLGDSFDRCESPSLRLEKFVSITPGQQTERAEELKSVVKCHNNHSKPPRILPLPHKNACQIEAYLLSNLVVNQSGGVLENAGLCLDAFHGYPYVPGSAIKGVSSHAAYQEWLENRKPELAMRIVEVFGFPTGHKELDAKLREWNGWEKDVAFAGKVSFLDAVPNPKSECKLTLDIATPHHTKYYQGDKTHPNATDNEDPVPIPFPAVKTGVEFLFRLVPLRGAVDEVMNDARGWLEQALTVYGLGAKTAAGMGWFELGPEPNRARKEKERAERDAAAAA
ncbi:MAG: type III-B CRISPR module RAMP protein Cmr6, partial [Victivallales bacterium]|nr:type III-B CRISPR module RAMP protein Cmr6 [Victivallales bacterium]MBR4612201.1 type III-B CRISPR module RAMP protein Cmr6 [Kiritimatiellia bacterium]